MSDNRNPLLSVQDLQVEYRASGAGDSRLAAVRGVGVLGPRRPVKARLLVGCEELRTAPQKPNMVGE